LIGKKFSDPEIQAEIKYFPFKIEAGPNDKPILVVEEKGETQRFTPEQILAIELTRMKEIASSNL
jgi:L1 cell adhesion molecule like protein